MTDPIDPEDRHDAAKFHRTLVKVLAMQVVALAVLWALQARYHS